MKTRLLKRLRGDSFFDIMSCHFHYYITKVENDRYRLGMRYAHIDLPIFYGNFKEVYKKWDRILRDDKRRKVMRRIKKWRIVYKVCAVMADSIGYSLQEIAQMNIEKIRSRQQRNKIHGNGDNR